MNVLMSIAGSHCSLFSFSESVQHRILHSRLNSSLCCTPIGKPVLSAQPTPSGEKETCASLVGDTIAVARQPASLICHGVQPRNGENVPPRSRHVSALSAAVRGQLRVPARRLVQLSVRKFAYVAGVGAVHGTIVGIFTCAVRSLGSIV